MYIGLSQQTIKLVFEKNAVIARPVRTLVVAIPLLSGEMYRKAPEMVKLAAICCSNRYLVPFNGGSATPVCALARNDSVIFDKHQFVERPG